MKKMETKFSTGLKELPPDSRDIQFGSIFSLPKLEELPPEGMLLPRPRWMKNQQDTDFCFAFASTSVSEDQEDVELDPLYQVMVAKVIQGDPQGWGCDLRSVAKSLVQYGSLEFKDAPFSIDIGRDYIVDAKNWMPSLDIKAANHRKASYAFISGPYDLFDNIRATLWKNRNYKKSVLTGVSWCPEWTSTDGIIDFNGTPQFGHALKLYDWKQINGQPMVVAQLSNGPIGDQGLFYFSRDIINSGFKYGSLTFTDLPADTIKKLATDGQRISDLPLTKLILFLRQLWG